MRCAASSVWRHWDTGEKKQTSRVDGNPSGRITIIITMPIMIKDHIRSVIIKNRYVRACRTARLPHSLTRRMTIKRMLLEMLLEDAKAVRYKFKTFFRSRFPFPGLQRNYCQSATATEPRQQLQVGARRRPLRSLGR